MAVSPNEDNAVCLTSSGRLNLIKLSGLMENKALKFPLIPPSHGQLTEQYPPRSDRPYSEEKERSMMREADYMLQSDNDDDDDDE